MSPILKLNIVLIISHTQKNVSDLVILWNKKKMVGEIEREISPEEREDMCVIWLIF